METEKESSVPLANLEAPISKAANRYLGAKLADPTDSKIPSDTVRLHEGNANATTQQGRKATKRPPGNAGPSSVPEVP